MGEGAVAVRVPRESVNDDTVKLVRWLMEEGDLVRSGQAVTLDGTFRHVPDGAVVPKEAVLEVDGKQFVYVVEDNNRYVKREVKATNFAPDQMRVLEGLVPGQRIVIKGAVLIKGQEVKGG